MLPGTIAWSSPRNHIGVHPESLLFNRDPEQLAADVIGLSEKYAALQNEHVSNFCPAKAFLPCPDNRLPVPPLLLKCNDIVMQSFRLADQLGVYEESFLR